MDKKNLNKNNIIDHRATLFYMVLGSNIVFKIVGEGVIVKEEAFVCDYTDIVIFVGVIKSHETREKTKIHTHIQKRNTNAHRNEAKYANVVCLHFTTKNNEYEQEE